MTRKLQDSDRYAGSMHPIAPERGHRLQQALKTVGFGYIGVGPQFITATHLLLIIGGTENNNGDLFEFGMLFQLLKHLSSVLLRHIQVEQDEPGKTLFLIRGL